MSTAQDEIRIGSLCTGYGGLDEAVQDVYGGTVAWHCQYDPTDRYQYAAQILAHHWPDIPNHGDITTVDFTTVEPVNILTAGFPCFPAGTLITTDSGLRPIEELAAGDRVLTHERRYRPVVQTMQRTATTVYTVKAMGAPAITTTDEHPFYAKRDKDAPAEWVAAKDLRKGHFVALPDTDTEHRPVSDEETARWYLVGRWLGDGWTVTHKRSDRANSTARRVHWCCATEEATALEKAFAEAGLSPTRVDDRTVVKYVMQSTEWADLLNSFGKFAHGKRIPEYVHALPAVLQAAMLDGWLDADGDIKADGAINGTTTSRALALGMARVARTVHGKAVSVHPGGSPRTFTIIEGRRVNEHPWWNVRISPGPSRQAFQAEGFTWAPVRSVTTNDQTVQVFNIGVQEDESYVAEGVVVHNCQDVSLAGLRAGIAEGTRSGLWRHVARAIETLNPELVVIENVPGLLSANADCDVEPCPWCVGDAGNEPLLRALGAVLGDLADLGFDAEWEVVQAAEVGAPHQRRRVFILAWRRDAAPHPDHEGTQRAGQTRRPQERHPASDDREYDNTRGETAEDAHGAARGERRIAAPGQAQAGRARPDTGGRGRVPAPRRGGQPEPDPAAAYTDGGRPEGHPERHGQAHDGQPEGARGLDTDGHDVQRQALEPNCPTCDCPLSDHDTEGLCAGCLHRIDPELGQPRHCPDDCPDCAIEAPADTESLRRGEGRPEPARQQGRPDTPLGSEPDWDEFAPAVRRWETVLGRPAPRPTDDRGRLSAAFVEWMMGLTPGHVTSVPGLPRSAQLKALGNGVVPQQAASALRALSARALGTPEADNALTLTT